MNGSRPWRLLLVGSLCGLIFEFVALADFRGARADDRDLLNAAGGNASNTPPPNIVFLVDKSGSMNDLICEDLDGSLYCDTNNSTTLRSRGAPNGATVCEDSALVALTGPDTNGDNILDPYRYLFDRTTPTTWRGYSLYPVFDPRSSGTTSDDYFLSAATFGLHTWGSASYSGSGSTDQARITDAIDQQCSTLTNCYQKSRCIYSLRTQGYYWEAPGCASGDPMSMCLSCGEGATANNSACTQNSDCDSRRCVSQGSCNAGATTNGSNCNSYTDCLSRYCTGGTSGGATANNAACTQNSDCDSRRCASLAGGATANGSACASNAVCASRRCVNLSCNQGATGNGSGCASAANCASRRCTGSPLKCQACTLTSQCNTGAGEQCLAGVCKLPGCGALSCQACAAAGDCTAPDNVCSSGLCTHVVCQACSVNGDCTGTDTCTSSKCRTHNTCQACTANGNCQSPDACTSNQCRTAGCGTSKCQACTGNGDCTAPDVCVSSRCQVWGCTRGLGSSAGVSIDPIILGDFLNFYPPKDIALVKILFDTMGSMTGDARFGISDFDDIGDLNAPACNPVGPNPIGASCSSRTDCQTRRCTGSPKKCQACTQNSNCSSGDSCSGGYCQVAGCSTNPGATIHYPVQPSCTDTLGTKKNACFDGDQATECFPKSTELAAAGGSTLENYLWNINFNSYTPLSKELNQIGAYYASTGTSGDGMCDYSGLSHCGDSASYVVVLTDGLPNEEPGSASELSYVYNNTTNFRDGYFNAGTNPTTYLDDVAKALNDIDARPDISGSQNVTTFAVSFGALDPTDSTKCVGILDQTATAGGGRCLSAKSVDELRLAVSSITVALSKTAHGFIAPSTPATRVSSSTSLQAAVLRPSERFPLWEGHLFGFKLCDEQFTANACTCVGGTTSSDVCVQDANGQPITFDANGYLTSKPVWDAQLCLSGDPASSAANTGPDQSGLDVSSCYRTGDETSVNPPPRVIYTAVEHGGDSATLTGADQIPFTLAAVTNAGYGSAFRTALAVGDASPYTSTKRVVSFYRGLDASDADGDGNTTEDRNLDDIHDGSNNFMDGWWKLGDSFHSAPAVVASPQSPDYAGGALGGYINTASYQGFATQWASRKKVLLIGANDGMLHAFHAGTWNSTTKTYDSGTGTELWAFVTPEMLPKLKGAFANVNTGQILAQQRWMVDGSVEVRDIWTGGANDKSVAANKSYWKTVAIFGHRQGGTTYVALDVTDVENPSLLWVFPQSNQTDLNGDPVSALMGESWLDVAPAPPSIGPLQVDADNNPATSGSYDRWVALVPGGYDALDAKGRALFVLDAWTGEIVWMAQKSATAPYTSMNYSFAATPVFYTSNGSDGLAYINGIVAADHGGQLWWIRPHSFPAIATSGRYSMDVQIAFRAGPPATTPIITDAVGGNHDSKLDANEYQRWPFFFAATLSPHNGDIRVIIGTGDRDTLIPDHTRAAGIVTDVCQDQQRLYSLSLFRTCQDLSGNTVPCTEANLVQMDPTVPRWGTESSGGWYYVLPAGEKAATTFNIFNSYALYSTFLPTLGCGVSNGSGGSGGTCSGGAQGVAHLYARQFITGKAFDWNHDNVIQAAEEVVSLGAGLPTAPVVSVATMGGAVTPTLVAGGSDSGLTTNTAAGMAMDLVMEIMRFPVSKGLHDCLHAGTQCR